MLSLRRPKQGRLLTGVCAGLANYFRLDVSIIRLVFVLGLLFFSRPLVLLTYLLLWLLSPEEDTLSGKETSD